VGVTEATRISALPSREGSQKQRLPLMEIPELRVLTQIATFSAHDREQKGELACQWRA